MLEALEDRNLLSVTGNEPQVPSAVVQADSYAAQAAISYIASAESSVAAEVQTVEYFEQQALLDIYRMESSIVQELLQPFMPQTLLPNSSVSSPSVKPASPESGQPQNQQSNSADLNDSAASEPTAMPIGETAPIGEVSPAGGTAPPDGDFSPSQISQAYGFNQITFNGTVKGDGTGQTIAIVDAYNQPNIVSDLQTFDSYYGIAAPPIFNIVNQTGGSTLPPGNAGWQGEETADVELAHAMAPGANIVLVEASSNSWSNLTTAINYARNISGVSVVSMSFTWQNTQDDGEFSTESSDDNYYTTPAGHTGVTFVAATGDNGNGDYEPAYQSTSPNVLAVGGTTLTTDAAGDYETESGWSLSGGGISAYESQPSYQQGVVTQSTTMRTVPDVALNALNYAIYDSYSGGGWQTFAGTSAATPIWASLIAIADQGRALNGEGTLDGPSQTLPALYQMPSSDFHDITTGNNGYPAEAGYDLVTGIGTPIANLVVNSLVSYDASYWQSVDLSSYYNQLGIASKAFSGGGLDGNGDALVVSANIDWEGTLIHLGPPNANDVISSSGQIITLPTGNYSSLTILAEAVNGNQTNEPFTVTYIGGATQTFDQSLTNWFSFPGYPYEQRAEAMADYMTADGTEVAGPTYMSAFVLPLNITKEVKSITLPNDANVEVLGMSLYYDATPAQPVGLSSYYNQLGIASKAFSGGGLDGNGDALVVSANIGWEGTLIPLGPPNTDDVISSSGQIITLPTGNYSSLTILTEAVNGNQTNEPFTVTYIGGATQTFDQSLTNWFSFPGYPYEQRAEAMADYMTADGTEVAGPTYMSAFVLPLNITKEVKSITLPNDANVEVLAMQLS